MFIKAKKKREELRLPTAHYIVADDWIDKLGEKAYCAWLRFLTWCDRTDDERDTDKIPYSLEKVAQRLGVSKPTLYQKYIQPLWEHGFIDLVEYEDSKRKTQKPVNIIVYEYPCNEKERETQPLEKVRDWKKDYNSDAKTFAERRKEYGKENLTVDRKENLTVDRKENLTVTVKKTLRNNVLNNSNNVLNNSLNNDSNTLLTDEEKKPVKETKLFNFLVSCKVNSDVSKAIVELVHQNGIEVHDYEVKTQLRDMYYQMNIEGKEIVSFPTYFLNGIIMQRQQRTMNKKRKQQLTIVKNQQENTKNSTVPFYNWLEN